MNVSPLPISGGGLYLLHAKLHLLVLHHQVTDVFDGQVPKQLDVIASNLIKKMCVGTSETKSRREKLYCTFIQRSLRGRERVQGSTDVIGKNFCFPSL